MGLDFSYMLYFKREMIWEVLQGLMENADLHKEPAIIHFPDRDWSVPLDTWGLEGNEYQFTDPEFSFALVLNFIEDESIRDYKSRLDQEDEFRGPPEPGEERIISIGYIYLTIYQEIPEEPSTDWVLFDFGTTGTRMSLLFEESSSIRAYFLSLLKRYNGSCGVFNREDTGEVFWLNGEEMAETIDDVYMLPEEIEEKLKGRI